MQALSHIGFDGVISIELEDVPGVSRGREAMHGAYRSTVSAGEAFDHENALSLAYLKEICGRLGIGGGDYATFGTPRENTDYRWWQ